MDTDADPATVSADAPRTATAATAATTATPAAQLTAPPMRRQLGGRAKAKRRLLTLFSGGDAFAYAAAAPETHGEWTVVGGSEKPTMWNLVELWEEEHDAKIIGTYEQVCAALERGDLDLGTLDAVVATPPCQDYASVNTDAAGASGPTGKYFADLPRFVRLIRRRHTVKAFVVEEVTGVEATPAFQDLMDTFRATNHWTAWGDVQFWLAGVATTRTRLGMVAAHAPAMKKPGPFALPGLLEAGAQIPEMPTLEPLLENPGDVDESLREPRDLMDMLGPEHQQSALPARQLGRMRGRGTNRFVYSVRAPALVMRANTARAEGLGGVTGLYLDAIGPRRLTPTEVLRLHGFPTRLAGKLPPLTVYHIVGNSVPVQWAAAVLNLLHELLQ